LNSFRWGLNCFLGVGSRYRTFDAELAADFFPMVSAAFIENVAAALQAYVAAELHLSVYVEAASYRINTGFPPELAASAKYVAAAFIL
jgi:hypothetical protein